MRLPSAAAAPSPQGAMMGERRRARDDRGSDVVQPQANPPLPSPAEPRELVVLVHGMGRTRVSMLPLAHALEKAGYEVLNWGYRSRSVSVSEAGQALAAQIAAGENDEQVCTVHFVGHSLGNIVIRHLLVHH